jgi:hypothetical protein
MGWGNSAVSVDKRVGEGLMGLDEDCVKVGGHPRGALHKACHGGGW